MLKQADVRVLRSGVLANGTIDGHDPIYATFRIKGPQGWFRLTEVSVNLGRGYDPGELMRNVAAILEKTADRQYVVILMQEIDEADPSPEHKVIRGMVPEGSTLVEWWTREPIVVWPGIPVRMQRRIMTMDQGSAIGAPKGTGPRRFFTSCVTEIEGVTIGHGDQHPHRVSPLWSKKAQLIVERARKRGEAVTHAEVARLVRICDLVIHGGDMNDLNYPKSHPREKVAMERGLDTIRYIVA